MSEIDLSFRDVVQLIRAKTGQGYADAAQVLDRAIEPHLAQAVNSPMGVSAWIEHGKKYGYYDFAFAQAAKDGEGKVWREVEDIAFKNALESRHALVVMEERWMAVLQSTQGESKVECPTCGGSGKLQMEGSWGNTAGKYPCDNCQGTGIIAGGHTNG